VAATDEKEASSTQRNYVATPRAARTEATISAPCHGSLFPVLHGTASFDAKHAHKHPRRTRHTATAGSEVIYRCRQPHNNTPDNGFSMPSPFSSYTIHTKYQGKKKTTH
ncbi:unnamed protein product, partial [Ectocarpus sp. 13 AM-2016]